MAARTTKARPKSASDSTISVIVNGQTFVLDVENCTAIDASDVRRRLGLSLRGLMAAAEEDPDIDIVACLVWLARRQAGEESLTFDEVASGIDYSAEVETEVSDEAKKESEGEA